MLDLVNRHAVWPENLKPVGDGDLEKESFASWWAKHEGKVSLPAELAEQWVYRHWTRSPFSFLALDRLHVREETWSTDEVLNHVTREWGITPNTDHDRKTFHGPWGPVSAAKWWTNGSWNIPMVILETPHGFVGHEGPNPDARYLLVEGHQRYRYLNLKVSDGEPTGPHRMFVLMIVP